MNKKLFLTSLSLAALVLAGCGEKPVDPGKPDDPNTPADPGDPDEPTYLGLEAYAKATFAKFAGQNTGGYTDAQYDEESDEYWFYVIYTSADGVTSSETAYAKGASYLLEGTTLDTPEAVTYEDGSTGYGANFVYGDKVAGGVSAYEEDSTYVFQFEAWDAQSADPDDPGEEENWYDFYVEAGYTYVEEGLTSEFVKTTLGITYEFPAIPIEAVYLVGEEEGVAYAIDWYFYVDSDITDDYLAEFTDIKVNQYSTSASFYDNEHTIAGQVFAYDEEYQEWHFRIYLFDALFTDELTEDTAWDETTSAYLEMLGLDLPFVQMGNDYEFTTDYVFMYGCYSIYDGYIEDLTAGWDFGFETVTDAESEYNGFYVTTNSDGDTFYLDVYWLDGNWIDIYVVEGKGQLVEATLVKDVAEITDGAQIVFGNATAGVVNGEASGKFLTAVEAQFAEDKVSFYSKEGDAITVNVVEGGYTFTIDEELLGTKAAKAFVYDDDSATNTWTISIDAESGNAVVASTNSSYGSIQYNAASPRFLNYASNQTAIQIYLINPISE